MWWLDPNEQREAEVFSQCYNRVATDEEFPYNGYCIWNAGATFADTDASIGWNCNLTDRGDLDMSNIYYAVGDGASAYVFAGVDYSSSDGEEDWDDEEEEEEFYDE